MYRVTETLEEHASNRTNIGDAKAVAYDAMYRMVGADQKLGWKHFDTIRNWTGKHTVLRAGNHAITMEIV